MRQTLKLGILVNGNLLSESIQGSRNHAQKFLLFLVVEFYHTFVTNVDYLD